MKISMIKSWVPAVALLLSMGLMNSCIGDLDVEPIDPNLTSEVDNDALFNKCYAAMATAGNGGANGDCDIDRLDGGTTGFMRQMFNANELTTDEAICGWGDEGISSFCYNQYNGSHPMLAGFYNRLYFCITMCNHYLEVCGKEPAADQTQRTAEIRFLRAYFYFHLMDCFGNVPFTTVVTAKKAKQMKRAELYKWIEEELLAIEPDMADAKAKKSSDKGYGRVDKAAAWLLLSRLYLNAEVYTDTPQWDKAKTYAKKVMDSDYKLNMEGVTYTITDPEADAVKTYTWSAYQMLFLGDNGETDAAYEAILPLLQDGIRTTSWGTSLFLMAGCFDDKMKRGEELGLTGTNGTSETWGGNRARKQLVQKFFPNDNAPLGTTTEILAQANDDRALFWGKGHTLTTDDPSQFTSGFGVTKFLNYYSTKATPHHGQFPDMDYFLMRKAEAYLTFAEADARLNGGNTTTDGTEAIKLIRKRANANTSSASYSLESIMDEWSREYFFEGRRRSDLIRLGKYGGISDYKWEWKGGTYSGTNFDAHLNIFAIPDTDLGANENLVQNPGY